MTAKLSENMRRLLIESEPGRRVMHGPTRAALMRRGFVYKMGHGLAGTLTPAGIAERDLLLAGRGGPPAKPEIEVGSIVTMGRGLWGWRVTEIRRGFAKLAMDGIAGEPWMPVEDLSLADQS